MSNLRRMIAGSAKLSPPATPIHQIRDATRYVELRELGVPVDLANDCCSPYVWQSYPAGVDGLVAWTNSQRNQHIRDLEWIEYIPEPKVDAPSMATCKLCCGVPDPSCGWHGE